MQDRFFESSAQAAANGLRVVLGPICGLLLSGLSACARLPDQPYHAISCAPAGCTPAERSRAIGTRTVWVDPYGEPTHNCASQAGAAADRHQYEQAWLEVKESGELWDQQQVEAITQRIADLHAQGKTVLVAAYVHGWHGNANEAPRTDGECVKELGQVDKFYAFAGRIADSVDRGVAAGAIPNRPVVLAVWVGWRGEDYKHPNSLTLPQSFVSRGWAADRIAMHRGQNSLVGAMSAINGALGADDRILLSGLSFGGRIITRMYASSASLREDEPVSAAFLAPFGSRGMVITFNPAIGADCLNAGLAASRPPSRSPTWITISSKDDNARGFFYRIGSQVFMSGTHCDAQAKNRNLAAGFDPAQLTHSLSFEHPAIFDHVPFARAFGPAAWVTAKPQNSVLEYNFRDSRAPLGPRGYSNEARRVEMTFKELRRPGSMWLVEADRSVFSDDRQPDSVNNFHSTVFTTDIVRLAVLALYDPAR